MRKTYDVYEIQELVNGKWEPSFHETNLDEAKAQVESYEENGYLVRIRKRRIKNGYVWTVNGQKPVW